MVLKKETSLEKKIDGTNVATMIRDPNADGTIWFGPASVLEN